MSNPIAGIDATAARDQAAEKAALREAYEDERVKIQAQLTCVLKDAADDQAVTVLTLKFLLDQVALTKAMIKRRK